MENLNIFEDTIKKLNIDLEKAELVLVNTAPNDYWSNHYFGLGHSETLVPENIVSNIQLIQEVFARRLEYEKNKGLR